MPANHGKEAWVKIKEFLSDADAQKAFLGNMPKKRKRTEVETSEAVPEESEANAVALAKRKPVKLALWQKILLDEVFTRCDGRPESESLEMLCTSSKLDKDQVIFTNKTQVFRFIWIQQCISCMPGCMQCLCVSTFPGIFQESLFIMIIYVGIYNMINHLIGSQPFFRRETTV